MYSFNELHEIIEKEIDGLEFSAPPEGLFEPMKYILGIGGKRLRPILVLLGANLYKDDLSKVCLPAIGIEIFHNFTLLHDDVMDNAPIRRKKKTVHEKWNSNVAILSGDAMSIKAYQYIGSCEDKYLRDVLTVFNQTALEVCEGQQFDMEFEDRNDVEIEEYLNMIRLKTAVLLGGSLKMGAIMGDASSKDAELLYHFGVNLGMAFQLQDDLLDVFGDEAVFGKKIGGDILSNKKTFLLINALETASGDVEKELKFWITTKSFNPEEKIKAVGTIYEQLNVREYSQNKIENYFALCLEYLDKVDVDAEKKKELYSLVKGLVDRSV
ncbi:polyprenyl synthetase family protein [Labilibaculum euxinus]|uniref:Polyprenyl synthetase family protein n=1 Tax=Labilibaculum euxinus TaxID=2686357 RepID=A0A7M4D2S0_9BACT|nr:polyprenyl synthetase family protein [Labilibaculum euxinus]MUP36949.1 polyprenyl synthetase family protein [Labilibaculum euxinus]MVB06154.1 polyprenyl synthetase family protein [Labilibaculum euxinus]